MNKTILVLVLFMLAIGIATKAMQDAKNKAMHQLTTLQAELAQEALATVEAQLPSWKAEAWAKRLQLQKKLTRPEALFDNSLPYPDLLAEMQGDIRYYVRRKANDVEERFIKAEMSAFLVLSDLIDRIENKKSDLRKPGVVSDDVEAQLATFRKEAEKLREQLVQK